jgi:hypothetical protein
MANGIRKPVAFPVTSKRKERRKALIRRLGKTAVAAIAMGALFLFVAAAPPARADDHSKCQHAIEKAEANLDKAILDHGEHSPQADGRRRDLNTERQHCWDQYHGWWTGKDHRWETEHNWDAGPGHP